jgi:hypothetical protein
MKKLLQLIPELSDNIYPLFLIDSIGAASSIVAALVVAQFESLFGIPSFVLYKLTILGFCFFLYSFTCYIVKVKAWRIFLKILATFNFLYCCITTGLIVHFFEQLTLLGILFFVFEIIIIVALAVFEWKTAATF